MHGIGVYPDFRWHGRCEALGKRNLSNAHGAQRHPLKIKPVKSKLKAPHPHPRPGAGLPIRSLRSMVTSDFVGGYLSR